MNMDLVFVVILWMIAMTIVTVGSVKIVKKYPAYGFAALTAFYVAYLLSSQVIATRISTFDLGTWFGYHLIFFTTTASIIYPFIAQVLDMINEVYGRKKAVVAIIIAFITQVLYILFVAMAMKIPGAPFFEFEEAWISIFALSIGITVGSWVAFLVCSLLDTYMFSYIKRKLHTKEESFKGDTFLNPYIWIRSLLTDAFSLALDSVIFVVVAFYIFGGMSGEYVIGLIVGQIVIKVLIGVADTPWFVLYKRLLGKTDLENTKFVEEKA
jgi:conserved hypothetical integral membrane protein